MRSSQRRRLLAASALLPLAGTASAQQRPRRVARIGWLGSGENTEATRRGVPFAGLRDGLKDKGWVEGDNLVIEARGGPTESASQMVAEIARQPLDLIAVEGGLVFRARGAVGTTPLLFTINGDPVEAGLVASYGRPGGSLTGVTNLSAELSGKRFEYLKEAVPQAKRFAVIANQGHPGWKVEQDATLAAARRLGLGAEWIGILTRQELAAALESVPAKGVQGLVVVPDTLTLSQGKVIAEFCQKHALPAISGWGEFAEAGNVMSYGPILHDVYAKLAGYADRILRGAKPADLPVENPTRFELVVNLKAAQAIRLAMPQSVLVRADRLIR